MKLSALVLIGASLLFASPTTAQIRTIVGRVVDARTGRPVPTGLVSVKGTELRDRLRPDGVFVLHPPVSMQNVTLVIQAQGYRADEILVTDETEAVSIRLSSDPVSLEPLALTTDGSVDATRLDGAPAMTVLQALQSKIAGIDVQGNSGVPAGNYQFRVRGVNTILGSVSPLVVVDGVVLSTASVGGGIAAVTGGRDVGYSRILDLNPNDIDRIEILKGARASMYGSRGANGVLLIRTKRGAGAARYRMK